MIEASVALSRYEREALFRVRWDDGRTSIFAPSAGVARIERRKTERVKA